MGRKLLIALMSLGAVFGADYPEMLMSRSGQFIVHGRSLPDSVVAARFAQGTNLVRLQPELVIVSAERIKAALLRQFHVNDQPAGKIHLVIRPDLLPNQTISVLSTKYNDGWNYRVDLPSRIEESKLVRAVSHVLLLELANRKGATRCAELPLWLSEGMCQTLLGAVRPEYLPQPAMATSLPAMRATFKTVNISSQTPFSNGNGSVDPLDRLRRRFESIPPLTLSDLSLKAIDNASGDYREAYEDSAQYLVHELLRMESGPARLRGFLEQLPYCWNWQTAFFQVYRDHFTNMREAEKWWSVVLLDLTARGNQSKLARSASLEKLNLLLRTETEIRTQTNALPSRGETILQQLVQESSFDTHRDVLEQKVRQLTLLAFTAHEDVVPLVLAYQNVLQSYLDRRTRAPASAAEARRDKTTRDHQAMREVIQQLDMLDFKQVEVSSSMSRVSVPSTKPSRK